MVPIAAGASCCAENGSRHTQNNIWNAAPFPTENKMMQILQIHILKVLSVLTTVRTEW